MTIYPKDGPGDPTTPLFEETANSTAVAFDAEPGPRAETAEHPGTGSRATGAAEDVAAEGREQAGRVGGVAADAGRRVASTTKEQASRVATDAAGQARELYAEVVDQVSEQASKQQHAAASTLSTLGDDLAQMRHQGDGEGLAAQLVETLSDRADRAARWLGNREPGEVLDEVKRFAARRPGLFIGLAAVTGVVAARATKALVADAEPSGPDAGRVDGDAAVGSAQ